MQCKYNEHTDPIDDPIRKEITLFKHDFLYLSTTYVVETVKVPCVSIDRLRRQ